jgi:hypothetical protein
MARTERRRRWAPSAAATLAAVLALAACGNARTRAPSVLQPLTPHGYRAVTLMRRRLSLLVPRNWSELRTEMRPPLLLVVTSGEGVIALSRYPRSAPPPADPAELALARDALVKAILAGHRGVVLHDVHTLALSGRPAIRLRATERIGGELRQVLSTHVFLPHSEAVLEEYAPPSAFASLSGAFAHVAASLRVLGPT